MTTTRQGLRLPKVKLKHGASQLAAGSSGLLLSHIGVAKFMGAPLRTLCPGAGLERDLAWLSERAETQTAEVALLFAHTGLAAVDAAAEERHGHAYTEYKARATIFPQSQAQVQMLLTRFCLATRLVTAPVRVPP